MHSYKIILFREQDGKLFREASLDLLHHIAPQIVFDPHTKLTQREAKALLNMASEAVLGSRAKVDLKLFEPLSPQSQNGESPS